MKKASLFSWALVGVGLVLLTMGMLIMVEKKAKLFDKDGFFTIGSKQFRLLQAYHRGEAALMYADQLAKYAAHPAFYDLAEQGGYYNESGCGSDFGYNLWIGEEDCFPDYKSSFKKFFGEQLTARLENYPDALIPSSYEYSLHGNEILGIALGPMEIIEEYVLGIGNPDDHNNEITPCPDVHCISMLATHYAWEYQTLPYVWGGESPYSYQMSVEDQMVKGEDSIFDNVWLSKYQPAGSGSSGLPTVPGFDCSGFVWWVLKHAGIRAFTYRDTAAGYLSIAQQQANLICSLNTQPCDKRMITRNAEPGDIMFIHPCDRVVCHIGIYAGGLEIIESIGGSGPVRRPIPDYYFPGGQYEIHSIYRFIPGRTYAPQPPYEVTSTFDGAIEPTTSFVHTIRPNFRSELDVDLAVYDEIIDTITNPQGLMTQVLVRRSTGEELESAVSSEIDRLNLEYQAGTSELSWSQECEDGYPTYFNNFVENYIGCVEASNDCVCNFTMDYRIGYNDENIIEFDLAAAGTTLKMGEHNYTISDQWVYEAYVLGDDVLQRVAIEIQYELRYRNEQFRDANLIFDARPIAQSNYLYLHRDAFGNMGFLPYDQVALVDYQSCVKPENRQFQFCVNTSQVVKIVNNETEELEDRHVIIKFALQFPEII